MIRLLAFLVVLILPIGANAQTPFSFCGAQALQLDFISDDPQLGASNVAEVHGVIEVPHPGYLYALVFQDMDSEGVVHGVLTLEDRGGMNAAVISTLDIRQNVDVTYGASKIVIEVVKPFNWGPSYYEAAVNRRETLCLKAR